ncbi:MAG: HAD family hydrolase [Bacteroidota bacterium]
MKLHALYILAILIACTSCTSNQEKNPTADTNYLSAWNDTDTKKRILNFVKEVTDPNSLSFVAPEDRIATFDLDGTTTIEKPDYVEVAFAKYYSKKRVAEDSTLATQEPYQAVLTNNETYLKDSVASLLTVPFDGMTQKKYNKELTEFLATKHPKFAVDYKYLYYKPMQELIAYLKANEFEVFISSYSLQTTVRYWTTHTFGLENENGIGTLIDLEYATDSNEFTRTDDYILTNAKKAEVIQYQIGKEPILAVGNTSGDLEMLEYSSNSKPNLTMIVNHDDATREYEYFDDDLLKEAKANNWIIISMKNDFKKLFGKPSE